MEYSIELLIKKMKKVGYDEEFVFSCNFDDLEDVIIKLNPTSLADVNNLIYKIGLYIKQGINSGKAKQEQILKLESINKEILWEKIRIITNKYISYKQYCEIINDIDKYEENNSLYYLTLLQCLYEGIYSPNLAEIKNLKMSDVHETYIDIDDDNEKYQLEVSSSLIENLKELSSIDMWERNNALAASGKAYYKLEGKNSDSCFKIMVRNNNLRGYDENCKFFYFNKLRKISREYVGYKTMPIHIYVSGIMYRICCKLKEADIDIKEAFSKHSRNRTVGKIIKDELSRVHYNIPVGHLRKMLTGYIDMFYENE